MSIKTIWRQIRSFSGVALAAISTTLLLPACSTVGGGQTQSTLIKRDGVSVALDHTVGVGFVFKDQASKERVCRTPGPDFASGKGGGMNLELPKGGDIGMESNYNAISMGGRAPGVLALRELMFRACELVLNTNATPEQALVIYQQFIKEGIRASQVLASSQGSASSSISSASMPNPDNSSYMNSDNSGANASWGSAANAYGTTTSSAAPDPTAGAMPSATSPGPLPPFNPNAGN